MKSSIFKLLHIIVSFVLTVLLATRAHACTTPALSGSSGDSTSNPPDSYITSIQANGTGIIQVTTYNPQTTQYTTKPFQIDGTNGITVTGGWSGGPGSYITSIILSGAQITFNGGPAKLTFVGATWSGPAFSWSGGGMTQIVSGNSTTLSVEGFASGHYSGATAILAGTCPPNGNFTKTAANNCYSLGIGEGGMVYYWGYEVGSYEVTGISEATALPIAIPSTQIVGATAIAAGANHACALLHGGTSGTVSCWGSNTVGQLGDGTFISRTTPAQVPGLTGVIAIAAGQSHTCAVLSSGAVKCWGDNSYGECGTGSTSSAYYGTPQSVPAITSGAHTIGAADGNTVAMVNGRAYTWGANFFGQLGLGGAVDDNAHATPAQITGLGTTVAIVGATNSGTVCSTSTSNALSCWGYNEYGSVGNGTQGSPVTSPTIVSGLTVSTIIPPSPGGAHNCAATASGSAYCWGYNSDGEVGVSPYQSDPLTPVQVSGMNSGVDWVGSGWLHSCYVKNGHVYCTGDNTCGELGNGTIVNSTVPVLVGGT